jgi:hypothetical protein
MSLSEFSNNFVRNASNIFLLAPAPGMNAYHNVVTSVGPDINVEQLLTSSLNDTVRAFLCAQTIVVEIHCMDY